MIGVKSSTKYETHFQLDHGSGSIAVSCVAMTLRSTEVFIALQWNLSLVGRCLAVYVRCVLFIISLTITLGPLLEPLLPQLLELVALLGEST